MPGPFLRHRQMSRITREILASGRKAAQQGDGFRKRSTHPTGFSVQTAPGMSPEVLASGAPRIEKYGQYSVSTVQLLNAIPGVNVSSTPGGGGLNHGTVTVPDPPPPGLFS